jgi:hypothetical protein
MGPDKFATAFTGVGTERARSEAGPADLLKKQADAAAAPPLASRP